MKVNALISMACVAGIAWFGAGCDKALTSSSDDDLMGMEARPGAIPVQKVVYWRDIPGMKWDWSTQITNAPAFVTQSVTNGLASTNEVNLKYTKPTNGIPKTDLDANVQISLGYADAAQFRAWYPDGSVTNESQFTSGLKYDLDGNGNALIKPFCNTGTAANDNSDKIGAVVIPPYIVDNNGVKHTVVGTLDSNFTYNNTNPNLTSIAIPTTVKHIGKSAFYGCSGLTSITIPDSVTDIGFWVFEDCSGLRSITIGTGVTNIVGRSFQDCSALTSITILGSVTSIGEAAFRNCSGLKSIKIPNSVTSIGEYAFNGCSGMTFIDFGDTAFSSIPTIGSFSFSRIPTTCKFIVPDSQYDTWKESSGWRSLVYTFLRHSKWEHVRKYELSLVATSGSYNDLSNKPTIPTVPTAVSSFTNDANYTSASTATNIARQIIRDAVSQVNVDLQSAEDTRATLTNLITILKNL